MTKDFLTWHEQKSLIQGKPNCVFFHEREVWWCNLGLNIGFEQDGKGEKFARPVLVLRKFSHQVFWGIPLTKSKKSSKYYVPLLIGSIDIGFAIISQLRLIDAKRLYQKLGDISHEDHEKIAKIVSALCLEPFKNSKG